MTKRQGACFLITCYLRHPSTNRRNVVDAPPFLIFCVENDEGEGQGPRIVVLFCASFELFLVELKRTDCIRPLHPCAGHQPDRDGDGGDRLRAEALLRRLPAAPQGEGVQLQVFFDDEADSGSGALFLFL